MKPYPRELTRKISAIKREKFYRKYIQKFIELFSDSFDEEYQNYVLDDEIIKVLVNIGSRETKREKANLKSILYHIFSQKARKKCMAKTIKIQLTSNFVYIQSYIENMLNDGLL